MPRTQQPSAQIRDDEGIFLNGYTFIIGAPKCSLERAYFDDALFAYMEKRAQEDPQFRGAYWEHFNDRDPCGKHSIVGDHYHIAVTRQRPREGEASSSALGCWVRDKAEGYGTEALEEQNIFKPSGLFLYLRRPPRSLAYYMKDVVVQVLFSTPEVRKPKVEPCCSMLCPSYTSPKPGPSSSSSLGSYLQIRQEQLKSWKSTSVKGT